MSARLSVIDPVGIRYVLDHPARGYRWSVRELAPVLGCSPAALSHLRSGARRTASAELAERLSDAVGVHPGVLFTQVRR